MPNAFVLTAKSDSHEKSANKAYPPQRFLLKISKCPISRREQEHCNYNWSFPHSGGGGNIFFILLRKHHSMTTFKEKRLFCCFPAIVLDNFIIRCLVVFFT